MGRTDYPQFMKMIELAEQKDINELTYVKTPEQIKLMKAASAVAVEVLADLDQHVRIGATTREIDAIARAAILKRHAVIDRVNFLNKHNLEHHESVSIMRNHTIYNELPDDEPLKTGDTINIDLSLKKEGWCADTSKMWIIGHDCSSLHRRLLAVAYEAMWVGIRMVKAAVRTGDLRYAVQRYVESQGFSMIRGPFTGRALYWSFTYGWFVFTVLGG